MAMQYEPSEIKQLAQRFPSNFTFGSATASWQIEGSSHSRGSSVWDDFAAVEGNIKDGTVADPACDSVNLYEEDIELLKHLGVDSYRFSVSWPRVYDFKNDKPNQEGIDYYSNLIDGLIEAGIKPTLTMYHWDLPSELQEKGGWQWPGITDEFAKYAGLLASNFADRVDTWATFNEPWVVSFLGHATKIHAPGLGDPRAGFISAYYQLVAHGKAMKVLRDHNVNRAGIVLNMTEILSDYDECSEAVKHVDNLQNGMWLDLLRGQISDYTKESTKEFTDWSFVDEEELKLASEPIDFLGINYYTPNRIEPGDEQEAFIVGQDAGVYPGCGNVKFVSREPKSLMGWEVRPESLTNTLRATAKAFPGIPLMVTENGGAFPDEIDGDEVHDPQRIDYYFQHISACADAIDEGIDLQGYYCWSLLDNIEWAEGLEKRFGLFHVDHQTQKRTAKDSAKFIKELLASR